MTLIGLIEGLKTIQARNTDATEYDSVESVLASVLSERMRQAQKWPDQPTYDNHHWSSILGEEYGEALKEMNEHDFGKLYKELIETAAVAVAWAQKVRKRIYETV